MYFEFFGRGFDIQRAQYFSHKPDIGFLLGSVEGNTDVTAVPAIGSHDAR